MPDLDLVLPARDQERVYARTIQARFLRGSAFGAEPNAIVSGGGHSTISQLKPAMRSEPVNRGHGGRHGYVLGMDTAVGNVAVAEDP